MSDVINLPARLAAPGTAFTAWIGIPDPIVAATLARESFDAVTLDMQHSAMDFQGVVRAIPAVAAAGKPAIARIPVGEFQTASRLLDAGAAAIIAPMINSVADARAFASFMKFPPIGERSWGPHGALAISGLAPQAYFAEANARSLAIAMIETRAALAVVDDILAVSGIDGVFVGPSDLSIALSDGAALDPGSKGVDEAIDHVLARARARGKFICVYANDPGHAAHLARKGVDLVAAASDAALLRLAAKQALATARGEAV
ncbi:aldolase/citrate lyase family protein [Chelatococcus sp. SYSU_G07232]|uniref:Aldolase/citrate lyase family protein n=1 Tax=Chelatococcus albus TaxID=3047466 RepID=A0ABT7AL75_9HYPH|nr:aldolase/citrate lyase family protein [Chelatococcus sp. SYSU_G07232]MDJ1159579.1 aldolase/citrate lyase family protein [Chelatococcus sp. SYSU_G07232]